VGRGDVRCLRRVDYETLARLEVRLGEERDLLPLGRDRGAGGHGVVRVRPQAVEDPVEVVAFVLRQLPAESDLPAHGSHELGVEAGVDAVLLYFEGWVRERGAHEPG